MGYLSALKGEITVEPPISWQDYKSSKFAAQQDGGDMDTSVVFRLNVQRTETVDGEIVTYRVISLISRYAGTAKHYNLREVAEHFGATHMFTGWLIRTGERQGDIERYRIDGTELVTEKAALTWPDGEKV